MDVYRNRKGSLKWKEVGVGKNSGQVSIQMVWKEMKGWGVRGKQRLCACEHEGTVAAVTSRANIKS